MQGQFSAAGVVVVKVAGAAGDEGAVAVAPPAVAEVRR